MQLNRIRNLCCAGLCCVPHFASPFFLIHDLFEMNATIGPFLHADHTKDRTGCSLSCSLASLLTCLFVYLFVCLLRPHNANENCAFTSCTHAHTHTHSAVSTYRINDINYATVCLRRTLCAVW